MHAADTALYVSESSVECKRSNAVTTLRTVVSLGYDKPLLAGYVATNNGIKIQEVYSVNRNEIRITITLRIMF